METTGTIFISLYFIYKFRMFRFWKVRWYKKNGLSSNALVKICELLLSIYQPKLIEELIYFATSWLLIFKVGLQSAYEDSGQIDTVDDDE